MKSEYAQKRGENRAFTCSKKKLPYVPTKDEIMKLLAYVDDVRLGFAIYTGVFQGIYLCLVLIRRGKLSLKGLLAVKIKLILVFSLFLPPESFLRLKK